MKRLLSFVLLLVMTLSSVLMLSCAKDADKVKVMVPNGVTLIAWGGLFDNNNVEIENVDGPSLLSGAFASQSHDIIVAPLNLGAKLYNAGNTKYQLDSMITFGNLYIVSKDGAALDDSLKDLEDKTLLAFGQNATPSIILEAALKNINCTIEYKNSVSEVVPFFVDTKEYSYDYAVVAEPVLSQLQINRGLNLNIVDLQEVFDSGMDLIPQAGVFVNPESKKLNKINQVLKALKDNINHLNQKPSEYAQEITKYHKSFENLTNEVIASAIQSGNVIDYKKAKDNKEVLEAYFDLLINQNKNLLNKLPEDGFYY